MDILAALILLGLVLVAVAAIAGLYQLNVQLMDDNRALTRTLADAPPAKRERVIVTEEQPYPVTR
ncbi:MAG: hypothetical protein IAE99_08305 [Rhodothermales bacterium]|nr:hypothetical protein [Rhodothermales bacterium]